MVNTKSTPKLLLFSLHFVHDWKSLWWWCWAVLEAHFINLLKTKPKVLLLTRKQAEQKGDKRTNGRTSELSENVTSWAVTALQLKRVYYMTWLERLFLFLVILHLFSPMIIIAILNSNWKVCINCQNTICASFVANIFAKSPHRELTSMIML